MKDLYIGLGILALMILFACFILFNWNSSTKPITRLPDDYRMIFEVRDGSNLDSKHGCFFKILAKKDVSTDPLKYNFFVAIKGGPFYKLDFALREYNITGNPIGGDRNSSYDYTKNGELWFDSEYIGFDMPKQEMGIEIQDGAVYEVTIKEKDGKQIFSGEFKYSVGNDQVSN